MSKQVFVALIAGIIIGGLVTFGIASASSTNRATNNEPDKNANSMEENSNSTDHTAGGSMTDMNAALEGKTGDEFDKEFITQMIEHHQGAIDMAKQAQLNAGRDEIKNMAQDIITAQEKEIEQMQQWQKDWGFTQ